MLKLCSKKAKELVSLEAQSKSRSSSVKEGSSLDEHSLKERIFRRLTCQAKQRNYCNKPQVNGEEYLMDWN